MGKFYCMGKPKSHQIHQMAFSHSIHICHQVVAFDAPHIKHK